MANHMGSRVGYYQLFEPCHALAMVLVARDIVEKEFLSLSRETTALEAARQMKAKRHGFAIITSATGGPEGIGNEWEYLSQIVAEGKGPSNVKLGEIMTR